jgi:hypothetical protein
MRKIILALAAFACIGGYAQVLTVASVDKLPLNPDPGTAVVAISPKGDYVLLSSYEKKGLTLLNIATGDEKVITDARGAGFDVKISQDGNTIVYREDNFNNNHLRYTGVKSANLLTGEQKTILEPSRDIEGVALEANTAAVVCNGKLKSKSVGSQSSSLQRPVLSIADGQLMMTKGGKTRIFSPNGQDKSYIWKSLSPDGTKVLYYVCSDGAYICNVDGTGVKSLGALRAPQWYGNDVVVGMLDIDNGYYVTSSSIIACNLKGVRQTLTDSGVIAMYPLPSSISGKIVFSTPAGEAYVINLK